MRPRDRHQDHLDGDHVLPQHPITEQRIGVGRRRPVVEPSGDALGAEMTREPERNAQPEQQLRDLCSRVAEMPALIERPEAEREMNHGGGIERDVDDRNPPPPDVIPEPLLHQWVGDVAERVIEEVREDVGEHDQPAGKPHLSHADAAQPRQCLRFGIKACRLHVTQSGCLDRHEPMACAALSSPRYRPGIARQIQETLA